MGRRRAARFSKLKPAELDLYYSYRKGERTHSVSRKANAAARKRFGCGIIPFALSAPTGAVAANKVLVSMTAQAENVRAALSISQAQCGIEPDTANVSGTIPAGTEFYPALFIPTLVDPAQTVPTSSGTSAFTGRDRKNWKTRSGSIPFGRTTTAKDSKTGTTETTIDDVDYGDMRKSLLTLLDAAPEGVKVKTVTFQPELLRPTLSVDDKLADYSSTTLSY